jgi:hypothetical protein
MIDPYYGQNMNPRLDFHRVNSISSGNCLAVLNYVLPLLAQEACPGFEGYGIVTVAGAMYLQYAWASISMVRRLDPDIPVEVWHLPGEHITAAEHAAFEPLRVTWHNVGPSFEHEGAYQRTGWAAKAHAIKASRLRHVLFLDADCYPVKTPREMFESAQYLQAGLLLWRDICDGYIQSYVWPAMGLLTGSVNEHEAGQFLFDKEKQWETLRLYCWMSGHRFFHDALFGDKNLPGIAAKKLCKPYIEAPLPKWIGYGIRHFWFDGSPAFIHAMGLKRGEGIPPPELAELFTEYDRLTIYAKPLQVA